VNLKLCSLHIFIIRVKRKTHFNYFDNDGHGSDPYGQNI